MAMCWAKDCLWILISLLYAPSVFIRPIFYVLRWGSRDLFSIRVVFINVVAFRVSDNRRPQMKNFQFILKAGFGKGSWASEVPKSRSAW